MEAQAFDLHDEDVYRVEDIRDHNPDEDLFLVKWKGYDESENTWEPRENLTERLVNEWFSRNNKSTDDNWLVHDVEATEEPVIPKDCEFPQLMRMINTSAHAYCEPHVVSVLSQGAIQAIHRCTVEEHECFCCNRQRMTTHMVIINGVSLRVGSVCIERVKKLNMAYRKMEQMETGAKNIKHLLSTLV